VGGKQARPDSGYSLPVRSLRGLPVSEVGEGNRKDIRNAVEAAHAAGAWAKLSGHQRAQILYYLAENLSARTEEFAQRIVTMTGDPIEAGVSEVDASISRLFTYAAWADKHDGAIHAVPIRGVALAMHEPWGVMALSCPDEAPLLAFVSLVAPAIALGNRVVVTPSPRWPLAATDLYQVLDTSDVPGGVVNVITGDRDELARTLAGHEEVACHWYVGSQAGSAAVERASVGNLKATWVNGGRGRDWYDPRQGEGREYLRRAVQVKNVWIPYGE
jgi:aldehyde dehydrogenase (NAD+)